MVTVDSARAIAVVADEIGLHEPEDPDRGVRGNARLTAVTGVALLLLFAAEGVTIPFTGPLRGAHVFIGLLMAPPVALKTGSTGWKIVRYYTRRPAYVAARPPPMWRRVLGPLVIASTFVVIGSGVALVLVHPRSGLLGTVHLASFIAWFALTSIHVLGHVVRVYRTSTLDWHDAIRGARPARGRAAAVLAVVLAGIPLGFLALHLG